MDCAVNHFISLNLVYTYQFSYLFLAVPKLPLNNDLNNEEDWSNINTPDSVVFWYYDLEYWTIPQTSNNEYKGNLYYRFVDAANNNTSRNKVN